MAGFSQDTQLPVNPNATREARALLHYLSRIDNNRILSGQHYPSTIFLYNGYLRDTYTTSLKSTF